jgi:hypothetical protein
MAAFFNSLEINCDSCLLVRLHSTLAARAKIPMAVQRSPNHYELPRGGAATCSCDGVPFPFFFRKPARVQTTETMRHGIGEDHELALARPPQKGAGILHGSEVALERG